MTQHRLGSVLAAGFGPEHTKRRLVKDEGRADAQCGAEHLALEGGDGGHPPEEGPGDPESGEGVDGSGCEVAQAERNGTLVAQAFEATVRRACCCGW